MSRFSRFGPAQGPTKIAKTSGTGEVYVDYKDVEALRRLMSPNGKMHGRKRTNVNASDQRKLAQAIKRARFMGLLPYTNATL
jgi:small subunit ribosomal protein S18